ncbi:DinB family protein [Rhodocaloribacter sp.]
MGTDRDTLRAAQLDQLAYLIDELEAQKPLLRRIPDWALEGRPFEGEWSIKERYGVLAAADVSVHLPQLRRIVEEDTPALEAPDRQAAASEAWNEVEIGALLERVQAARTALTAFLRALTPEQWARTGSVGGVPQDVYAYVHGIIQHDADGLRAIGYRLHESHLTARASDLPK